MAKSNLYAKFMNLCEDNPISKEKINTLLKEELYFSTVYGLNDFNELQYIAPSSTARDGKTQKWSDYVTRNIENMNESDFENIEENLILNGLQPKSALEIKEILYKIYRGHKTVDTCCGDRLRLIVEYFFFKSVGICSFTSSKVFDNCAANVIMGHYAGNLRGIILIFNDPESSMKEITYKNTGRGGCGAERVDKIFEIKKGNLKNLKMPEFLRKLPSWSYEQEYRLIETPGGHKWSKFNLDLKAILYTTLTPKFFVSQMRDKFPEKLHLIYPSYMSNRIFELAENNSTVSDFFHQI